MPAFFLCNLFSMNVFNLDLSLFSNDIIAQVLHVKHLCAACPRHAHIPVKPTKKLRHSS